MRFPPEFLDDIRQRLSVSAVVGKHVPLKRHGREYVGLSPFKKEKTPSFTVNDEKGFYHCFSSGEHGDIFTFLMKVEGLSFPEAVERLAAEAGIAMPMRSPDEARKYERRSSLLDCTEAAAKWFTAQLHAGVGTGARDYLQRRGVSDGTAEAFGLGFAPPRRTALKDALTARGFDEGRLLEAGLIIRPEDGGATFDRFRNRLMFPIRDRRGRVVAFGGRALDDAPAKYLNSPETPLFHKGRLLFNLDRARQASRETDRLIVVEGYMDVIGLAEAGFADAVAPLGTALTEDQMAELWRLVPEPILCFDGDEAGRRAAYRAAERVLPILRPGCSLMFAYLPEGEDPDSLVSGQGAAAMTLLLDEARSLADVLWDMLRTQHRTDTPERQAGFEAAVDKMVRTIRDPKIRSHYGREMRRRTGALFAPPRGTQGFRRSRDQGPPPITPALKKTLLALSGTEARLLREAVIVMTAINHPELVERYDEVFSELILHAPDLDKLRSVIIPIIAQAPGLDSRGLKSHLHQQGYGAQLSKLEMQAGGRSDTEWFIREDAAIQDVQKAWLHLIHRQLKLQVQDELATMADSAADPADLDALVSKVRAQLDDREGEEASIEGYGIASGHTKAPD